MLDTDIQRATRLAELRALTARTMARIHRAFPEEALAIAQWKRNLPVGLVLGAARGGTSAFKAALAQHGAVLAMPGEHRLFFTLTGQNFPDCMTAMEAAEMPPDAEILDEIWDLLLTSAFSGTEVAEPDPSEAMRYALDWAMRLPMQWTSHEIDPERVVSCVEAGLARYRARGRFELTLLDHDVLDELRQVYPFVDPGLYDGGAPGPGGRDWAQVSAEITPIVEITPFVMPRPRQLKTPQSEVSLLLLKASSDPFRIAALRAMCAGRPVRVLRLTRNPLASVNGLLDGWAHPAFWQHDLRGRAELPPEMQGWCFDLFPGWSEMAPTASLVDIAARQWSVPNSLIAAAEAAPTPNETWHRFAFEAFQRGAGPRRALLEEAARALGLSPADPLFVQAIATPLQVNVTQAPEMARWRRTRPELRGLVEKPGIARIAWELEYSEDEIDAWI